MVNHQFYWVNPASMAIFHSYVKLPEGMLNVTAMSGYMPSNTWLHMSYGTVPLGIETPIEIIGPLRGLGAPQNMKGLTILHHQKLAFHD